MADESEVLDWDEDDTQAPLVAADDDEDAVSLGASDEEVEAAFITPETDVVENPQPPPPSASPEVKETTPNKRQTPPSRHGNSGSRARGDRDRDRDRDRRRDNGRDDRDRDRDHPNRERRPPKTVLAPPVVHALPPKPVMAAVPVFTSHGGGMEATLMASSLKDSKDGKPKSASIPTEGKPKSSSAPNGSGTPGTHHANLKNSSTDRDRDTYKSSGADRDRDRDADDRDRDLLRQSSSSSARNPNNSSNPSNSPQYSTNTNARAPYKGAWERSGSAERERERERDVRPRDRDRDRRTDDRDRRADDHNRDRERDRPSAHATRGQQHRDRRDEPMSMQNSNGHSLEGAGNANAKQSEDDMLMSYDDRHYRPGGSDYAPNNSDHSHNAHSLRSRPKSPSPPPPSRGGRAPGGRGRGGGRVVGSPPPRESLHDHDHDHNPNSIPNPNPNTIRSTPGTMSMSSYPERPGQGWGPGPGIEHDRERERDRDRKYHREERAHDRGDLERDRDQRGVQGQGQGPGSYSAGQGQGQGQARAFDDGRDRERRDGRDREPRERREREPGPSRRDRDREADTWARERELPPHQYERERRYNDYDSAYDAHAGANTSANANLNARKQDGGRDTPPPQGRSSNNNSLNLTQSQNQSHPRERDPQPSMPMHHRDPPREQREPQPRPIVSAPRHSRRSRSRSGSPPGGQGQQKKREKSRFAPAPAPVGDGARGASVGSSGSVVGVVPALSQAPTSGVPPLLGYSIPSMDEVDEFVPDELLEDVRGKEAERPRELEKERERERKEERGKDPEREREEREKIEEPTTTRKRAPLPPQNEIFVSRHKQSSMPARFPPSGADHLPLGPRDALPPPLPSGPRRSDSRGGQPTPVQVDTDIDMPSPRDAHPQLSAQQQPNSLAQTPGQGPTAPIRAGSGMYADREPGPASASTDGGSGGLPKGPRAMNANATTPTGGSFGYVPQSTAGGGSAVEGSGGYGPGRARGRDRGRSSPPHLGGHGDRVHSRGGEGYRGRVRGSYISGSNNTPIGIRQPSSTSPGESRYSAPGPPVGGFEGFPDNGYPGRGRGKGRGRGRGRGGPDFGGSVGHPRDSYRPDNGPDTEPGHYGPPALLEERNASPSYSRPKDHYDETQQSRFDREPAPHRRYVENESYSSSAPPRAPSQTTQATPSWEYNDSRHDRPDRYSRRAEDGPLSADGIKPERDMYPPIDEPNRVRSLEARLAPSSGDFYSQSSQESRQTHPLPLNPSLRRDTYSSDELRQSTSHGHSQSFHEPEEERRGSFRKERDSIPHSDNLFDRVGGYDDGGRPPRVARIRRTDPSLDSNAAQALDAPSGSSHYRAPEDPSEHGQRPPGPHRSVSLLERMAVGDGSGDGKAGNFDEPPSLRERVQIPSKRDWDDMGGMDSSPEKYSREPYMDGDEESVSKRRKKNGKPRRGGRRGPA